MLVKKTKKKAAVRDVRPNVPIVVEGFEDVTTKEGEVLRAVVGTDLVNREKVSIVLTNRGKEAESEQRKSVGDLEKGYTMGENFKQLVPGGMVSFRSAFPLNESQSESGAKVLMSPWANVLAYMDKAAYKESVAPALQDKMNYPIVTLARANVNFKGGDVAEGESKISGGRVYLYVTDSCYNGPLDGIAEGVEIPASLEKKIENEKTTSNIGFMVRILDENGRVLEAVENFQRWDSDEDRPLTADERKVILTDVASDLAGELEDLAASVSITPVFAYPMSTKSNPGSFIGAHYACRNHLGEVDGEPCHETKVHKCAIKFSRTTDDGTIFVNSIHPYTPSSKEGLSLALFDGREYAPSYQAKIDAIVESNDDPSEDDRGPSPA